MCMRAQLETIAVRPHAERISDMWTRGLYRRAMKSLSRPRVTGRPAASTAMSSSSSACAFLAMGKTLQEVQARTDAREVERHLGRFVRRVVVLVVRRQGHDDGWDAEDAREDEIGR